MLCPSVISRFGTLADKQRFDAASAMGLGRVKTQACVASVEDLEGIAHRESQIMLRI